MPQNTTFEESQNSTQVRALAALLQGQTVTEAAAAAAVDRTTIHRWLKSDSGFRAAYHQGIRDLRTASATRLLALAEKATRVVEKALDADDPKTAIAILRGLGLLSADGLPNAPDAVNASLNIAQIMMRRVDMYIEHLPPEVRIKVLEGIRQQMFRDGEVPALGMSPEIIPEGDTTKPPGSNGPGAGRGDNAGNGHGQT